MQEYEDLKTIIADLEDDMNKTERGSKAAGTRVRKQMQEIKKVATSIRSKILEIRASE
jgi:predicted  nucleic acid-binding Zn-ribbon protein